MEVSAIENFASRLADLRKERGLTQTDVSRLIGKARTSVQGYETEGKEPSFEILCFLAEYFGVSTDYLLGRTDSRTHDDAVFANDTRNFASLYAGLPADLKKVVGSSFDSFYVMLSHDVKLRAVDRLQLYSALFSVLQRNRAEIRNRIEAGPPAAGDLSYFSEIMALQSDFKNSVDVLLDQLLQSDLGSGASKKGSASGF